MKTEKNILIAFLLNFAFAVFECLGGIFTGSVAIISDAVHDVGDAASIGISYFLEKKTRKTATRARHSSYATCADLKWMKTPFSPYPNPLSVHRRAKQLSKKRPYTTATIKRRSHPMI
jgi:hypothetical protein